MAFTLTAYAAELRDKPVDQVETADVLTCPTPIWTTKPETASRVRGRIEAVLDAAKAKNLWREQGLVTSSRRGHRTEWRFALPAP